MWVAFSRCFCASSTSFVFRKRMQYHFSKAHQLTGYYIVTDPSYRFVLGFLVSPYSSQLANPSQLPNNRAIERASDRWIDGSVARVSDRASEQWISRAIITRAAEFRLTNTSGAVTALALCAANKDWTLSRKALKACSFRSASTKHAVERSSVQQS